MRACVCLCVRVCVSLTKGIGKLKNTVFFIQGLAVVVMLVDVVVVVVEVLIIVVEVVANISVDCLHARDGVHPSANNTIYSHVHDTLLRPLNRFPTVW